jgi:hypothetical protein
MRLLANVVSFQCVWLSCVWGAGHGMGWLGPLVLVVHLGLHRLVAGAGWSAEMRYAALAAAIGGTADSALQWLGLLELTSSPWGTAFVPPWMLALWVGFSTLLDHALRWLRDRLLLAVLLGAAAGALTYWTAERLGALTPLAGPAFTYGAVALLWAVAMPVLAQTSPRSSAAPVSPPRS